MKENKRTIEEIVEFFTTRKYYTKGIQRKREILHTWYDIRTIDGYCGIQYDIKMIFEDYKEFIKELKDMEIYSYEDKKILTSNLILNFEDIEMLYSILSRK